MSKPAAKTAKGPRVFVPLTKVDEEKRLVYGTMTQEVLDKAGEVMDYETSKPLFQKWSDDIHEASGGLSKGNLRVMHGLSVAGKVTEMEFDDDNKAIEICTKIVDDGEWNKVLEGCYTGFSVGGSYAKRWTETGQDNGEEVKIKKFTARPNEVSLVDNPCVPTATFSLIKADGAEEAVAFQVENDDEQWPDFAKADVVEEPKPAEVKKAAAPTVAEPKNDDVVKKAEEMAKAAADGTTWMNHVEAARNELLKGGMTQLLLETRDDEGDGKKKEVGADEGAEETEAVDDTAPAEAAAEKVTPAGVKQVWTASDGKTFEKKEDAVKHEATLTKAEPTEAEKLQARLAKATSEDPEEEEPDLFDDFERLGKVIQVLESPHNEDGSPVLQKGMYTVERFARVLWDLGKLTKSIAKEGAAENNDSSDETVAADIKKAMGDLGDSFKTYVADQVTELLAGIDDEAYVCYYDYYYAAAKDNSGDQLAKDVCTVLESAKDESRERRETLTKAFTVEIVEADELSPPMQKRFEALEKDRDDFKKIAEDAVGQIEELKKSVKRLEDTPLPRAPRNIIEKGGETLFGKTVNSTEDKVAVVKEFIETHGAEGVAIELIKAAHATGGRQLALKS